MFWPTGQIRSNLGEGFQNEFEPYRDLINHWGGYIKEIGEPEHPSLNRMVELRLENHPHAWSDNYGPGGFVSMTGGEAFTRLHNMLTKENGTI